MPPARGIAVAVAVDLGGRRVEVAHLGPGHTEGDLVVVVPDADLLFVGDLVESAPTPETGAPWWGPDSVPHAWGATLDGVIGLMTGTTRAVPGHGEPVDREFVFGTRGRVAAVSGELTHLVETGVAEADALARGSWPYPAEHVAGGVAPGYAALAPQHPTLALPGVPRLGDSGEPGEGRGRSRPWRRRWASPPRPSPTPTTGPTSCPADLRARILAKAAELGYAGPDAAGRTLRVGRSGAVGVLLTEQLSYAFSDPFAVEFLTGLTEVVEQHQTSVLLMPLSFSGNEPDVTAIQRASIDALTIMCLPEQHPAAALARARGIRFVGTDIRDDPDSSWVAIDDLRGGVLVGEHLAALGHRDVAVLVERNAPAGREVVELDPAEVTFLDYASPAARPAAEPARPAHPGLGRAQRAGLGRGRRPRADGPLPTRRRPSSGLSDVLALGALTALAELGVDVPGRGLGLRLRRHRRRGRPRPDDRPAADPRAGPPGRPAAGRRRRRAAAGAAADRAGARGSTGPRPGSR